MAGEYLDPSQWPLWMQSGAMGPAPSERTLPRDLYTSRFRKIQQEHPAPWDQSSLDEVTSMGLQSALPLGMVARGMAAAPKLATGLLGGLSYLYGTDQTGAQEPDQVKQLQATLQKQGLYRGAIDGRMGPETQRAQQEFERMRAQQEQMRLQQEQAAAARAGAEAQSAAAAAQLEETRRAAAAEQNRTQEREAGNQRMNEMESNLPWYSRMIRDYSTPLGIGTGVLIGGATRGKVVGASNRASAGAAAGAEGVMDAAAKGLPARVARANEFWRRGGGEVPFLPTPGASPGFASNPAMTPASGLYAPATRSNLAKDIGIMGGFGAESAVGQAYLVPHAQEELRAANEAASADPSEINIRRLQAAKDSAAIMEGLMNFGRAGAAGYGAGALKMHRTNAVPNMTKAETELLKIQEELRKRAPAIPMQQAPMLPVGVPPAFGGAGAYRARQM
jgi:peptidoglycan hydrolase-like protein with peptidoglycan-binding domain